MIELKNVYKKFDQMLVLDGIDFTIEKGETFVIIGLSGTGKTVTLKHIAGLLDPDAGEVIIDGIKMNEASEIVKSKLRSKMGVVFQSGALINWLSVGDNVALPLREHKKYPEKEIEKIVDEKLKLLHLDDAKEKMPADISGGMKKRAGLARVLVRNPEIILYDEPTSGLDPVMSSHINELIKKMHREFGVTSLVVTHDMESAYYIADRIAMIYNGKIVQCDTPDAIQNSSNPIVQQFIQGSLGGPIKVD
jgi:phospholipid/cholesterol/gamma-HCH transport system ATP-binding protein